MFSLPALSATEPKLAFEFSYGTGPIVASDFNSARAVDYGQTMTGLDKFTGLGVSISYRIFSFAGLMLSYEKNSYTSPDFTVATTSTSDAFFYEPLVLLVEIPLVKTEMFFASIRGGGGYATKFQYEQKFGGVVNETLVWKANPNFGRLGLALGFMMTPGLGLVLSAYHDSPSSALKADGNSQIFAYYQKGNDYAGGVRADMSGTRYSGGLRVAF